jgi:hypothetical protein
MSHVATIDIEVRDLAALAEAAKRIGMEFVQDQKHYRWWGRHEGDYPLPAGFTEQDLGNCEHALRIADAPTSGLGAAYEIGVVKRRDGKPGYTLLWDFIDSRLRKTVGENCGLLKQAYALVVAKKAAMAKGFRVQETQLPNGQVQLRCVK